MHVTDFNPWFMAFFWAHFPHVALFAFGFFVYRVFRRRVTRREVALMGIFLLMVVAEVVMLSLGNHRSIGAFGSIDRYGLERYFGAFAPLLWVFCAGLLAKIWFAAFRLSAVRWVARGLVVLFLGAVFGLINVGNRLESYGRNAGVDALVAARRVAPIIRRDYAGPRRRPDFKYQLKEYFTSRRPTVFSYFGAPAWVVGGQSEGANHGNYPYPDDYLFIRIGQGYRGMTERIDPKVYEYVVTVPGNGTIWRLFRRRGTPHR